MSHKLPLLACILFLVACGASHETKTFTPRHAHNDNAIVYLYRPSVMSNAIYSPDLFVNKEYKLPIKNGHKTIMVLAPGKTLFEIEPDKNYSGQTELRLILEAGNSYFIRVGTSLKIKNSTSYEPYQRSFDLKSVDEKSVDEAVSVSAFVDAILLDSGNQKLEVKELGGTGRTHDWTISRKIRDAVFVPVYLAGGINANNVLDAVKEVEPFGIDLCSGVRENGKLNEKRLEEFFSVLQDRNS